MSKLDDFMLMLLAVMLCGVFIYSGYIISERNYCIKSGGVYSLDFGICMSKGELR